MLAGWATIMLEFGGRTRSSPCRLAFLTPMVQLPNATLLRFTTMRGACRSTVREPPLSKYVLKLYVAGANARTERAVANLRRICEQELANLYELEIVDVLENPQVAEDDRILATPTLIKQLPPPLRRVVGDLSDKEKVLFGLEVRPGPPNAPPNPSTPKS